MLLNRTTGETVARHIVRCDTFWRRGRGLMFRRRRSVAGGQVYLFVEGREGVAQATIHMLFVFFPIAVVWLDRERRVVDTRLALPFRPYYAPACPAMYYVEGDRSLLERVHVGDQLDFS